MPTFLSKSVVNFIDHVAWRISFEVALLEFRPEGAATHQPRASPWELGLWPRILFRPFRAGRILIRIGFPGRCPWAFLLRPVRGAEKRNTKTDKGGLWMDGSK